MFLALKTSMSFRLLSCACSENQAHGCPIRTARDSAGCLRGGQFRGVEAIYFTGHGQRGAVIIVEISDASKIPSIAELWFLTFNAIVELKIVKTPDDL
jgi:hypothetical protein